MHHQTLHFFPFASFFFGRKSVPSTKMTEYFCFSQYNAHTGHESHVSFHFESSQPRVNHSESSLYLESCQVNESSDIKTQVNPTTIKEISKVLESKINTGASQRQQEQNREDPTPAPDDNIWRLATDFSAWRQIPASGDRANSWRQRYFSSVRARSLSKWLFRSHTAISGSLVRQLAPISKLT